MNGIEPPRPWNIAGLPKCATDARLTDSSSFGSVAGAFQPLPASPYVSSVTRAPYGATVTFSPSERPGGGWNAPVMADWLSDSVKRASTTYFGKPAMFDGLGGSIPFMSMLGERFPQSQFLVTGVMGPGSNAHGPNEFIDLPTGVRVTACVAQVIADHTARSQK